MGIPYSRQINAAFEQVTPLVAAGFRLLVREPWWYRHRMLRLDAPRANLHVFASDAAEPVRHRLFRDWLRHDESDRRLYEETKRALARKDWDATNDYSEAKGAVVAAILVRAQRWAAS